MTTRALHAWVPLDDYVRSRGSAVAACGRGILLLVLIAGLTIFLVTGGHLLGRGRPVR